ncbi:hypothetical protein A6770_07850 [Nostoc minutum NIES-26]|uniref:Uncharacterized protein n=1 Tax=Nostoc minutum NIES-26 TaxID=1844469 RepID=A0A367S043_9NOSO|nr:hypothetical protein A6770_07850 [Nostoc minutum NIES-26]
MQLIEQNFSASSPFPKVFFMQFLQFMRFLIQTIIAISCIFWYSSEKQLHELLNNSFGNDYYVQKFTVSTIQPSISKPFFR